MPILKRVRRLRQESGVKVGPFLAPLSCSRSHFVSVENGTRPASPELTQEIARRLTEVRAAQGLSAVTADDLLDETPHTAVIDVASAS